MESKNYVAILGRILIGVPFIASGLSKLTTHDGTVGYISSVGLPFPELAFIVAILVEVGGGMLLISGYKARVVSLVIALFTLVTAFVFHHKLGDQNQLFHFLKNVIIAGGLLQITYFGTGSSESANKRLESKKSSDTTQRI